MEINFQNLSDSLFEELCFDLLLDFGFEKLTLRSGGADSGRDIQGVKYINEQFVVVIMNLGFSNVSAIKALLIKMY